MPIDPIAPVAAAPADRLSLQTSVVRGADAVPSYAGILVPFMCFADDTAPSWSYPPPGMCFAFCT